MFGEGPDYACQLTSYDLTNQAGREQPIDSNLPETVLNNRDEFPT